MSIPTISVIGLGNWGTALANHLATKGFPVLGWSRDPDAAQSINREHKNPHYLSEVSLHVNFRATASLNEALQNNFIVMTFPSSALSELIPMFALKEGSTLVSAVKGLEHKTCLTPLQFVGQKLQSKVSLAVLSGPSFARDIVIHKPSGVVAASLDEKVARMVADVFTSDWMKVYISTDPLGVEIGGIAKNVIALASGVSDGLGLGDSARAGLITRGLAEMTRLAKAMGVDERTLFGLSGLGDLVVTATSGLSRNRTVGLRLGKGEKLEEIVLTLGSVAEGVATAPLVLALSKKFNVEMPITEQVTKFLKGEVSAKDGVRYLLGRPMKREFEG